MRHEVYSIYRRANNGKNRNFAKGIRQVEEIRAHLFGPHIVVNLTIGIDGDLTVTEGDAIATSAEKLICESIPNGMRIHIHYHPTVSKYENMTIYEILVNSQQHIFPGQPDCSE